MIISRRNTYAYYRGSCIIVYVSSGRRSVSAEERKNVILPPTTTWSTSAELLRLKSACTVHDIYTRTAVRDLSIYGNLLEYVLYIIIIIIIDVNRGFSPR